MPRSWEYEQNNRGHSRSSFCRMATFFSPGCWCRLQQSSWWLILLVMRTRDLHSVNMSRLPTYKLLKDCHGSEDQRTGTKHSTKLRKWEDVLREILIFISAASLLSVQYLLGERSAREYLSSRLTISTSCLPRKLISYFRSLLTKCKMGWKVLTEYPERRCCG